MIFWKILQQQFFDQEQEFNNINTISYMNVLMARVDQYISGDHNSSQVTLRLQLISVAEVQDCICCCFLWTQIFCNLYHGEGCACYTNEMVRLVKQNYCLKYHLHTQHHFSHQVCLGCILSVGHVPMYHLRRVGKCQIIKAEQNWQNVFDQNWCRMPHNFSRPTTRLQTSQMSKLHQVLLLIL